MQLSVPWWTISSRITQCLFPGKWMWKYAMTSVWPCLSLSVYIFSFCFGLSWGGEISAQLILESRLLLVYVNAVFVVLAYFDYYNKYFSDLCGFDSTSCLLHNGIWMYVCPCSNQFQLFLDGDLEGSGVAHALLMGGAAAFSTPYARSRAVTGDSMGEAASTTGPGRRSSCNFH